jgi:hypothetical protein
MNRYAVFALRLFLGLIFAILVTRLFHPEKGPVFILCITGLLVGLSYLFAFMRSGKRKE